MLSVLVTCYTLLPPYPVDNSRTVVGEIPDPYAILAFMHCGLSMDCQLSAGCKARDWKLELRNIVLRHKNMLQIPSDHLNSCVHTLLMDQYQNFAVMSLQKAIHISIAFYCQSLKKY